MSFPERINVEYEQRIQDMLSAIRKGNRKEFDRLVETVGHELRKLSAYFLRRTPNQTLQTTALVNEVMIRLLRMIEDDPARMPETKSHFIALTSRMMRFTLVDYAKAPRRRLPTVPLETGEAGDGQRPGEQQASPHARSWLPQENLLLVNEALDELAQDDRQYHKRRCEIIELHIFGGMKYTEIADLLKISTDKARRDCEAGLLWLRDKLTSSDQAGT